MSELQSLLRDIKWLSIHRPRGWRAKVRGLVRRCHALHQIISG